MMQNEFTRELLEKNNKIFKALHEIYDFDFMQEFQIIKINGRFTHNSIKKALGLPEYYGMNTAVIITDLRYREKYTYIVGVNNSGFGISHPRNAYGLGADYFFSVGGFEEARKTEDKTAYVICQKEECKAQASQKKPDYSQRFKYVRYIGWGDGKGKHGISQIDIKDLQHNGKCLTIKTRNSASSTDINYYIDKSGYLIEEKKADLKQKAKALRTQREKAAADAANFDSEVNAINDRLNVVKTKAAEKLTAASNFDDIANVNKIVSSLRWLYIDVDCFAERNANKQFSSISAATNSFNSIIAKLEELEATL